MKQKPNTPVKKKTTAKAVSKKPVVTKKQSVTKKAVKKPIATKKRAAVKKTTPLKKTTTVKKKLVLKQHHLIKLPALVGLAILAISVTVLFHSVTVLAADNSNGNYRKCNVFLKLFRISCSDTPIAKPTPANPSNPSTPTPSPATPAGATDIPYLKKGQSYDRGVNIYTMEYTKGQSGYANLGEPQSSYDYLAKTGITTIRLATPWVRYQPVVAENRSNPTAAELRTSLKRPVDKQYLAAVQQEVDKIERAGMRTVLDLHNGCTYPWGPGDAPRSYISCGTKDGITIENVQNIWKVLSDQFKNDKSVIAYDIMNEPRYSVGQEVWKKYSQAMTDTIRGNKDTHTLWVESLLGPIRGRLAVSAPQGPWIKDPLNKTMYSEHFYFSPVENGSSITDKDFNTRLTAIKEFGEWCKKFGVRCSIGEIGYPRDFNEPRRIASKQQYEKYSEESYKLANQYKLDVSYFAATRLQCTGYIAYCSSKKSDPNVGIDTSNWQATVVQRHLTR